MIDVKLVVKIGSVRDMFSRLSNIDTKAVLVGLKPDSSYDQRQHDKQEMGPDGKWPALHPSTIARRARMTRTKSGRKRVAVKLLGRLPKALQLIASNRSLIVRSRVSWSLAHQAGAIVGWGSRLPRRQFLWISAWLVQQARNAFTKALVAAGRRSL